MHILLHVCEYIHMHVYMIYIYIYVYISLKTLDPVEAHLLFAQEFQGCEFCRRIAGQAMGRLRN